MDSVVALMASSFGPFGPFADAPTPTRVLEDDDVFARGGEAPCSADLGTKVPELGESFTAGNLHRPESVIPWAGRGADIRDTGFGLTAFKIPLQVTGVEWIGLKVRV